MKKNFYVEGFNQIDGKLIIPETLLNFTIPHKTQEWFNNFVKAIQGFKEINKEK